MATLPCSSSSKTLTLSSPNIFLESYRSFSQTSPPPQTSPPLCFSLLSQQSPLPRIPTDNFPQSKLIPKTRFIVDGFRNSGDYSISYFLSHFHSDHYAGLNPSWSRGLIFCSEITARLLIQVLNISPFFVVSLSLGESAFIDECEVILIDAGHCPGAVQFLFKIPEIQGTYKRYVHTGDFRFCSSMKLEPKLSEFVGADAIFLDTTYCNPKFCFPSQTESVEYIVKTIARIRDENKGLEKSVLFLIATYVVGKERILVEVSQKCNCLIHVDSRKMEILRALALGEKECGIFTEDASLSDVHVIGWNILGETWPYFRPNYTQMKEIMVERGYSKAVGFVPTGWMYEMKRHGFSERSKDSFEIHLVPYSEHSSYDELREYVRFLKPKCVIPTVGIDVEKLDSKHVIAMRKHFSGLVDEMANKKEFLKGFHQRSVDTDQMEANDFNVDLSKVLTKEKEVNLLNKFSENQNNTLPDFVLGTKCSFNERGSEDSDVLNEKHTEELVQEIQDLLPVTISQDQKLDMLSTSHGSIVEAVSDCYECNTEFHEQVVACRTSSAISQRSSLSASSLLTASSSASLPELVPDKGNSHGSVRCTSSEKKQSLNIEPSLTNTVSARKRGPALQSKANKKGKASPTLEPTGSKQSTITKFFSKLAPNASQVHAVGNASTTGQYPSNDILLPHDAVEPYREELDLFLQVVGDSVSTEHAASILAKTNGDINLALDAYYSSGCEISNKEETVAFRSKLAQAQSVNECSGGNLKDFSKTKSVSSLSVHGLSPCNVDSNLVSLPLDRYSPVEHACWNAGQPAPYLHLARTFDLMEGERGKIKAAGLLCNMFRSLLVLSPEDLLPAVYLCTNKIAAAHENMELNIGGSIVTAALEEACGTNRSKIREMYNKLGDLGDVAQLCRQTQLLLAPPCALSIQEVFSVLRKISLETGNGSTARKKNLIVNLMRSCREKEIKFLVRTLVRNLRIGAMMRTVLPALAQSIVINSSPDGLHEGGLKEKLQSVSAAVVEAYNILPSLDMLVPSLLKEGIEFSSSTLSMTPGIPIKPMLARITNGVSEALKRFQGRAFTCEYKYDGQRAQIHKLVDGSVRIFSRNGDETTFRFPDVVNIIKESCKPAARTFIVDAEVVAVDRKNGCKLMSFQELSSREKGSKSSIVSVDSIKVDICVFVFDVMFANGEQLLSFPLRRRRQYLKDLFLDEKFGYFEYAKQITVESDDRCLNSEATLVRISSFFEDAFNSSCEGIMVKSLDVDAGYVASKRTDSWLKVKRDYLEGLNDSLDLVPIGAWHGNGRKAGWYSPFLMACYNPDTEEFQSVCRVMSGFSDSFYSEMKEFYTGEKILSKKPPYYQTAEVPDRWFSPELVWEIRGADFTISPVHQAAIGLVHPSRGISVRFPRFVRSVSDRRAEDCSTSEDVANMFQSQTRKMDVKMED